MIFQQTGLQGAYLIQPELLEDERGLFGRTYCQREFEAHGLNTKLAQCNLSFNVKRHTLRGMHYQGDPHPEAKLVRCTLGAIWDAIIDLRPDSPTHKQWFGVELSAENRHMLYVPEHFAHGFQTLVDESEVFYQMSEFYHPDCGRGVRWNDPAFAIAWPHSVTMISDRDAAYPDYTR